MNWLTLKVALYACAALTALCLGTYGVMALRLNNAKDETAQVQAEFDAYKAALTLAWGKAKAAADAQEQEDRDQNQRTAEAYEQGKRDAQAAGERVSADLRADNLRLRHHWRGCETDRLSATTTRAAQPDAGDELRAAGAGDLVRIIAACEAQLRGLQQVVRNMGG